MSEDLKSLAFFTMRFSGKARLRSVSTTCWWGQALIGGFAATGHMGSWVIEQSTFITNLAIYKTVGAEWGKVPIVHHVCSIFFSFLHLFRFFAYLFSFLASDFGWF